MYKLYFLIKIQQIIMIGKVQLNHNWLVGKLKRTVNETVLVGFPMVNGVPGAFDTVNRKVGSIHHERSLVDHAGLLPRCDRD